MCVTLSTADDFEELTELWEASVRAILTDESKLRSIFERLYKEEIQQRE